MSKTLASARVFLLYGQNRSMECLDKWFHDSFYNSDVGREDQKLTFAMANLLHN